MGKRKAGDSLNEDEPTAKKCGPVNFSLLGKDIAVLQQFVDLLDEEYDTDDSDSYDIVKDYLEKHDGSELIAWLRDAFSRKQKELRTILEALSGVLLRTARDLKPKHGEVGRRLGDQIMENDINVVLRVFQPGLTASVKKSGLKLLASLVAQDVLVAGALFKRFNWRNSAFLELAKLHNKMDSSDVRSWFVNYIFSFFILGDNSLMRSMLENKDVMDLVIRGAYIDKYSTVMLIIKVLHEKVIKNSSISKTQKIRLFHKRCMNDLGNLMNWRGEATNHKEWAGRLKFPTIDSEEMKERIVNVQEALFALLEDLATSTKWGIAFFDKFVGTSTNFCNGNLVELFNNLNDPRDSPQIKELLLNCVSVCPDILPVYLTKLAPFLQPRPSDKWFSSMQLMTDLYQFIPDVVKSLSCCAEVCSPDQIARAIANLTLVPSSLVNMLVKASDKSVPAVYEKADSLIQVLTKRFRRALSWLQTTDKISDSVQKSNISDKLQKIVHEVIQVEQWNKIFIDLFSENLYDPSLLKSEEQILPEISEKSQPETISEESLLQSLPEELQVAINTIENAENMDTKTALILQHLQDHFKHPLVLRALCTVCSLAATNMKKKLYKPFITNILSTLISHEEFLSFLAPTTAEITKSEMSQHSNGKLIDLLLVIYQNIPKKFMRLVPVLPLLAAYNATVKESDQKLLYLIYSYEKADKLDDIIQSPYVWGARTHEYYKIQKNLTSVIWRQTQATVSMSILDDNLMELSAFNFPIKRPWLEFYKEHFETYPVEREVYDPCFVLHVLSTLLRRNYDQVDLKSFYLKNCLIYCIAALTSGSRHIRALGKAIIVRYIDLLKAESIVGFPRQPLLLLILNHIRYSLVSHSKQIYQMRNQTEKVPGSVPNPLALIPTDRLSSPHAHWYMKFVITIAKPYSPIHSSLSNILLYKPVFNLTKVPYFFVFLFSAQNDHRIQRQWILKLIAESLRDNMDFLVMENSGVFKHLMVLYTAPTLDHSSQVNILKLIESAVRIPRVAKYLICNHGLTIWLHQRLRELKDKRKRDILDTVLKLLAQLYSDSDIGIVVSQLCQDYQELTNSNV